MCAVVPVLIGAAMAVSSVAANQAANRAANATEKQLKQQANNRANQLSDQASAEINERAKAIRQAAASARASASGAGINLGSNSFLAQLQSFDAQLDEAQGLQTKNLNNSIKANSDSLNVSLSQITHKTGLGIAVDAGIAGVSGYMAAGGKFTKDKPPGKP